MNSHLKFIYIDNSAFLERKAILQTGKQCLRDHVEAFTIWDKLLHYSTIRSFCILFFYSFFRNNRHKATKTISTVNLILTYQNYCAYWVRNSSFPVIVFLSLINIISLLKLFLFMIENTKTGTASPATILKQEKANRKTYSCMLY